MRKKRPRNKNSGIKLKAFRISLVYFFFGCLWILFSDNLVDRLFVDSRDIINASTYKGLFYVVTTALLIYFLIYPSFRKLKQNEERLHRSQEISKSGSWEITAGSGMLLASDHFLHLLDLDNRNNLISIDDIEVMIHEQDRGPFHEALSEILSDNRVKGEMYFRLKPRGHEDFLDFYCIAENEHNKNGKVTKVFGVVVEITRLKRLEEEGILLKEQAWNQQKLESIGTLASGVAHEINNPINGIMNYGQIIVDSTDSDSEIHKYGKEIIYETGRVSGIVRNLLDFSRQPGNQPAYARMEDIIQRTLSLINTIFKHENISLNVKIDENIPECKCQSQRIQQVIMNLLTNARDSLNDKYDGGYNENKKIDVVCHGFIRDNLNFVSVSVKDYGQGIPDEVSARIFDPFFTTKDRSKGTGLGLPISYGIVKEHNGELSFESKMGEFTEFTMTIPCKN